MPETVTVTTPDGDMGLYDVAPDGDPKGAVIVVQEAFGVNGHIEEVARRFAAAGYRAVSPHLFHRSGDPTLPYDDLSQVMPHMQALSEKGIGDDLDATLSYLSGAGFPAGRVGIVGFCMGGTVAFFAGVQHRLGAAVSFYGGGVGKGRFGYPSQVDAAPKMQSPWLGLFGDRDQSIPVDEVEQLRRAVSSAPVPNEVVRYPEAEHGFHCDARPSYHAPSAEDAWRRTLDWLGRHLA